MDDMFHNSFNLRENITDAMLQLPSKEVNANLNNNIFTCCPYFQSDKDPRNHCKEIHNIITSARKSNIASYISKFYTRIGEIIDLPTGATKQNVFHTFVANDFNYPKTINDLLDSKFATDKQAARNRRIIAGASRGPSPKGPRGPSPKGPKGPSPKGPRGPSPKGPRGPVAGKRPRVKPRVRDPVVHDHPPVAVAAMGRRGQIDICNKRGKTGSTKLTIAEIKQILTRAKVSYKSTDKKSELCAKLVDAYANGKIKDPRVTRMLRGA